MPYSLTYLFGKAEKANLSRRVENRIDVLLIRFSNYLQSFNKTLARAQQILSQTFRCHENGFVRRERSRVEGARKMI